MTFSKTLAITVSIPIGINKPINAYHSNIARGHHFTMALIQVFL